jgi:cytochrome c553
MCILPLTRWGSVYPVQYPRIGGQWAEYTETQLTSFRAGARKNAQMNTIAAKLSDTRVKGSF